MLALSVGEELRFTSNTFFGRIFQFLAHFFELGLMHRFVCDEMCCDFLNKCHIFCCVVSPRGAQLAVIKIQLQLLLASNTEL